MDVLRAGALAWRHRVEHVLHLSLVALRTLHFHQKHFRHAVREHGGDAAFADLIVKS